MSYGYRYLDPENGFDFEVPKPAEPGAWPDESFEKLFRLDAEELDVKHRGPVSRYLGYQLAESNLDVQQLRDEIVSRRRLMDRQIEEMDHQISRASWSLRQLEFRVGYNAAIDFKRNWTERELANMRRERRSLRLGCWEDIVALRKQLREAMKQYRDARVRKQMMEPDEDGS